MQIIICISDTTPLLMVVGGFSKVANVSTSQGLLKDVELISTTPNNIWYYLG
jgi:hypothetical protein